MPHSAAAILRLLSPAIPSRRRSPRNKARSHTLRDRSADHQCALPRGSSRASTTGAKPFRQFSLRARTGSLTLLAVSYSTDNTRPTTSFEDEHSTKASSTSNIISPLCRQSPASRRPAHHSESCEGKSMPHAKTEVNISPRDSGILAP